MCVIVTNSTPPTIKRSSGDLLPHGDPDMIGGFRVARCCVAGMESRYGLVFTKSSLSPMTGSPQKTWYLIRYCVDKYFYFFCDNYSSFIYVVIEIVGIYINSINIKCEILSWPESYRTYLNIMWNTLIMWSGNQNKVYTVEMTDQQRSAVRTTCVGDGKLISLTQIV